jgi:UDP-glucose 4-epimerase
MLLVQFDGFGVAFSRSYPNENNLKTCRAKYGIEEMCRDLWNWASKNPYGYAGSLDNGK